MVKMSPLSRDLPVATLRRLRTSDEGTFGFLRFGGRQLMAGELPWRDNALGLSCIPPGRYCCLPANSESRGPHFRVLDVPERVRILIHSGHWCGDKARARHTDAHGSLLVGLSVADLAGQMAVLRSRPALDWLVAAAPAGFVLEISDGTPGRQAGPGRAE